MNCKEKGCKGEIDETNPEYLPVGCRRAPGPAVYPCKRCGRLHLKDGSLVFDNSDNKVFLEHEKIVLKDKNNQVVEY